jgi:hypothetical protein
VAPEIQTAAILSLDNRLRGLADIGDKLTGEQFARMLDESYKGLEPGQRPTVEEARLGIRAMRHELPSDQQAAVNEYAGQVRANVAQRTKDAVAGKGSSELPAEQLRSDLLQSVVDNEMAQLKAKLDVTNRRKAAALRPATETTAQYGEALATAEDAMAGKPVVRGPDVTPAPPPLVDVARVGQTRQAVKEHGAPVAQRHLDLIESFAGAEKPKFPSGKVFRGKKVGEGDWLDQIPTSERMRLSTEGWFSPKKGNGMDIDVWADMLERNGAPGVHDVGSAVDWYLNEIRNVWDAKRGTHEEVLRNAGDQLGLDPNHVREIARGGRQGVADVIDSMGDQMARTREEFRALPDEKRAEFADYIETLKEYGSDDADYADVIGNFLPGFAGEGGLEARLTGRVPIVDVADYLIRESDPTYRPALPREVARMNRSVGALLNEMRRRQAEYRRHDRRGKMLQGQMENLHETLDKPLQDRVAATGDAFVTKARNVAARLPEDVAGQAMAAVETAAREAERVQGARLDLPRRVNEALANFREHMTQAQQADLDRAMTRWQGRRTRLLARTFDRNMEAVPARFRPTLTAARDNVNTLLQMADEATDVAGRDYLLGLAEEITTNLSSLTKDGIDPAHLIGGMPRSGARPERRDRHVDPQGEPGVPAQGRVRAGAGRGRHAHRGGRRHEPGPQRNARPHRGAVRPGRVRSGGRRRRHGARRAGRRGAGCRLPSLAGARHPGRRSKGRNQGGARAGVPGPGVVGQADGQGDAGPGVGDRQGQDQPAAVVAALARATSPATSSWLPSTVASTRCAWPARWPTSCGRRRRRT